MWTQHHQLTFTCQARHIHSFLPRRPPHPRAFSSAVNRLLARTTKVQRHHYYNAIVPACQTVANDVTSTLGHGGLGLATGACDNLCPTQKPRSFHLGKRPRHPSPAAVALPPSFPPSLGSAVMWLNVLILQRAFEYGFISALSLIPPCHSPAWLPPPPFTEQRAAQRLRACRLTRGFVVLPPGGKASRQGEGPGPVVADVWLLQRKRAMREYGNVCSEWHHARLARPALRGATLARPFHVWDGLRDERGQRRLAGWMQAWDQTAGGGGDSDERLII